MLTYDLIRNFTDIILPAMFKPNHFTSSSSFITLLVVVMGGSKSKPVVESARKVLEKRVLNDTPLNSSIKNVSLKYTPDNNNSHVAPSSSSSSISSSKQSVLDEIEINNAMFKDMSKFPTIKTSTAYENQVNNTSYIHMQFMVKHGYMTIYLYMYGLPDHFITELSCHIIHLLSLCCDFEFCLQNHSIPINIFIIHWTMLPLS